MSVNVELFDLLGDPFRFAIPVVAIGEEQHERQARFGSAALKEASGATIVADLHDIETYRRLRIGPYHPRSGVPLPLSEEDEAFFSETLRRARAYRELMTYDPSTEYPPMAVVAASNAPTPVTWVRSSQLVAKSDHR